MITGNKPKAETFRLVLRDMLSFCTWRYTCHVLMSLYTRGVISLSQYRACCRYLEGMLDGCNSYNVWLAKHHPKVVAQARDDFYACNRMWREGRIAWVKHIIEVLES